MKRIALLAALALALPAAAQEAPVTPALIIAGAPKTDWTAIAPEDLLVMDLAPDRDGNPRRVVIQLMPAPFSQGWVGNIRKLAAAHWWDGTTIYRVQDNYVVQWGDATEEKALPDGLSVVPESEYVLAKGSEAYDRIERTVARKYASKLPADHRAAMLDKDGEVIPSQRDGFLHAYLGPPDFGLADNYADGAGFLFGWPLASDNAGVSPTHCYGMVGVARNLSPDTGTGAELYTVIGHAPRQLDRNIALAGRVIEGIEHLTTLPRGKSDLGFYGDDEIARRVPITSVRLGSDLASSSETVGQQGNAEKPRFEYLSTESDSFARYAHVRANRQDDFYRAPAGGVDICNVPVPIRRVTP